MVLVLSATAMASSHVGREVERAASKHKQIIAFRIDAAALSPALEYFLSDSQWIDVQALGISAALSKLADAAGQGAWATNAAAPVILANRVRPSIGGNSKRIVIVAAVIGAGVAVALGMHFWSSDRKDASAEFAPVSDKSIGVLPFADLSEKNDQEYFADGIAEEVLDRLAKVPGLRVVGRASSFQFKGRNVDPASIGQRSALVTCWRAACAKRPGAFG